MNYIYFIQSGSSGPIKIGMSNDPRRRLEQLQTAHLMPLTLIGMTPGGRREERRWHKRFSELRITGEWFHMTPDLMIEIFEALEDPWQI